MNVALCLTMKPQPIEKNESLCWTCLRAGWDCLCLWPYKPPPGAVIEEYTVRNETVRVVVDCPWYWPEETV